MNNFGEALKEIRMGKGLTLKEIENHTGISTQNLSRWERGEVLPNIDFCIQLAQFYDCTLDELVGLSDEPTNGKNAFPQKRSKAEIGFVNEYAELFSDSSFIQTAKLYKAISPELRALALGYIVGVLQNNGVNTKNILGY